MTYRTPATNCPSCGYAIDAASGIGKNSDGEMTPDDAVPTPGDLSLCLCCLSYLTFTDGLALRVLTPSEFLELPEIIRGQLILARQAGWALDIPRQVNAARRARRSP